MPETFPWRLAFEAYAAEHPEVGTAIVDIAHVPPDYTRAVQYSVGSYLVYDGQVTAVVTAPVRGQVLFFEDSTFYDVGPWLQRYAAATGVPIAGLIGLIHAECGFNTFAERRGVWPDVSAGYSQMTVQTAAGYGIGDGSNSEANINYVFSRLVDRETGIDLASRHYAMCLGVVDGKFPGIAGDARLVMGLRAYNGGTGYGLTEHYASKFASHIAAYEQAVASAHRVLYNKGYRE